jgi:hypothetical protein
MLRAPPSSWPTPRSSRPCVQKEAAKDEVKSKMANVLRWLQDEPRRCSRARKLRASFIPVRYKLKKSSSANELPGAVAGCPRVSGDCPGRSHPRAAAATRVLATGQQVSRQHDIDKVSCLPAQRDADAALADPQLTSACSRPIPGPAAQRHGQSTSQQRSRGGGQDLQEVPARRFSREPALSAPPVVVAARQQRWWLLPRRQSPRRLFASPQALPLLLSCCYCRRPAATASCATPAFRAADKRPEREQARACQARVAAQPQRERQEGGRQAGGRVAGYARPGQPVVITTQQRTRSHKKALRDEMRLKVGQQLTSAVLAQLTPVVPLPLPSPLLLH